MFLVFVLLFNFPNFFVFADRITNPFISSSLWNFSTNRFLSIISKMFQFSPYKVTMSSFYFQIVSISIPNQLSNLLKETNWFPFLHFKETLIILEFFLLFSISHNNWGLLNCFFDDKEKICRNLLTFGTRLDGRGRVRIETIGNIKVWHHTFVTDRSQRVGSWKLGKKVYLNLLVPKK